MKSNVKINHTRILRVLIAVSVIGVISALYVRENIAQAGNPVRGAGNGYRAAPTPPPTPRGGD